MISLIQELKLDLKEQFKESLKYNKEFADEIYDNIFKLKWKKQFGFEYKDNQNYIITFQYNNQNLIIDTSEFVRCLKTCDHYNFLVRYDIQFNKSINDRVKYIRLNYGNMPYKYHIVTNLIDDNRAKRIDLFTLSLRS